MMRDAKAHTRGSGRPSRGVAVALLGAAWLMPLAAAGIQGETLLSEPDGMGSLLTSLWRSLDAEETTGPAGMHPLLGTLYGDQAVRNHETTLRILPLSLVGEASAPDLFLAVVREATAWQAQTLVELSRPGLAPPGEGPLDVDPGKDAAGGRSSFAHVPSSEWGASGPEGRDAVHGVLAAFSALDQAAREAFPDAALLVPLPTGAGRGGAGLGADATGWPPSPQATAAVLAARLSLLEAAAALGQAWAAHEPTSRAVCQPYQVPPLVSIDWDACDNVYEEDYALIIDRGGNDTYHNNAGGSAIQEFPNACGSVLRASHFPASAVFDYGGHDAYGDPDAPRSCGVNGAGFWGVAVLYDEWGDDAYVGDHSSVNGGAIRGFGLLLDGAGNDTYRARIHAANGAGSSGSGMILDLEGNDSYVTQWTSDVGIAFGANGGAQSEGTGFLYDHSGQDLYVSGGWGTNGGSKDRRSVGFLLDREGDDVYIARHVATNGGGWSQGIGFLYDRRGDDTYEATRTATNGGAFLGTGMLIDREGDDSYTAGPDGTNGGSSSAWPGVGVLYDGGGFDVYLDANDPPGTGTDRTVVPKGILGAQIDHEE